MIKKPMLSERYSRQVVLRQIGSRGQSRLLQSRILVVGMGGLGCPVSLYLAGAGVGRIGLIDADRVDESNLQRQILFRTAECGELKVVAAKKHLELLNPDVSIEAIPFRLNSANVETVFSQFDLVIDGTDNFSTKFLINDAAVKLGLPVVYGSVSQFEGQVSVFSANHGPCYRCLYPSPPRSRIQNCAESGVLGALAGVIGSIQALEAIKVIVSGADPKHPLQPLIGKFLMMDTGSWRISTPKISKNINCPVCSLDHDQILLTESEELCDLNTIDFDSFTKLEHCTAVDVRDASEWLQGHLPGAIHLPLSEIETSDAITLSKDRTYVLYCKSGMRSEKALEILTARGFKNIKHLRGGLLSLGSRGALLKTDLLQL